MSSCEEGQFVYELLYVHPLFTPLGAFLGFIFGLGMGMVLLCVALPVYDIVMVLTGRNEKPNIECLDFCKFGHDDTVSILSSRASLQGYNLEETWPRFSIPYLWSELAFKIQEDESNQSKDEVGFQEHFKHISSRSFKLSSQSLGPHSLEISSLVEILTMDRSTAKLALPVYHTRKILEVDITKIAILLEGFSLLKDALYKHGFQSALSISEVSQDIEEIIQELKIHLKQREILLGSLITQSGNDIIESLLNWEKQWNNKKMSAVRLLNEGVTLIEDIWNQKKSKENGESVDVRTIWSEYQNSVVQQLEKQLAQMRYRVLPLEELVLNEVNAYQKHFEGHIKQLSDRLMEIIGREIINSQLIDGEKEKILGYANAFMETLKKQINRSSMTINASGQSFRGFDSIRRQLKEVKRRVCMDGDYKKMTSSFLSVVEEQEKKQELQKSEQLHASLKEFLSQNEQWLLDLFDEVANCGWMFKAKEVSSNVTFQSKLKEACKVVSDDVKSTLIETQEELKDKILRPVCIYIEELQKKTDSIRNPIEREGLLDQFSHSVATSHTIMSEVLDSMDPLLQLRCSSLLEQYMTKNKVMECSLTLSLQRLNTSFKESNRCKKKFGKQKAKATEQTPNPQDEAKAKEQTSSYSDEEVASDIMKLAQSHLESDARNFLKREEEALETAFETARKDFQRESQLEDSKRRILSGVKNNLITKAVSSTGMTHLVSEKILQEHNTAVRKIQEDINKAKQHQLLMIQQKIQAKRLLQQRQISKEQEDLVSITANSAVGRALLLLLMEVRQKRAEKELEKELNIEHGRQLRQLEAKLSTQLKKRLKTKELQVIQEIAKACKMTSEELTATVQASTLGSRDTTDVVLAEVMHGYAIKSEIG